MSHLYKIYFIFKYKNYAIHTINTAINTTINNAIIVTKPIKQEAATTGIKQKAKNVIEVMMGSIYAYRVQEIKKEKELRYWRRKKISYLFSAIEHPNDQNFEKI